MSTSALTRKPRLACPPTILKAYKLGDFTDLIINCGPLVFKVHAVVVCTSCDFFLKSLKFAIGKEAEQKCIDLPEDEPESIRRLITYLYLGDYDPNHGMALAQFGAIAQHESTSAANPTHHHRKGAIGFGGSVTDICACLAPNAKHTDQPVAKKTDEQTDHKVYEKAANAVEVANPLTIHASMYALGDKYQVDGLSQLAKEKFESCLHHHAHSEDFVSAVQIAYSTTPDSNRGLRDSVMEAFRVHFKTDIASIPGAEAKLDTIDELSFLLIKSWPVQIENKKPVPSPTPLSPIPPAIPTGSPGFGIPGTGNIATSRPATSCLFGSTFLPGNTAASRPAPSGLFGSTPSPGNTTTSRPANSGLFGSTPSPGNTAASASATSSLFR